MGVGNHHEGCKAKADGVGAQSHAVAAEHLYGDVLDSVVELLPAADLAATVEVSREWLRAVRSVLRRQPRRLPWLVVHLFGSRRQTAAYDPHSGAWLVVHAAPRHATPANFRLVRSARGDRVCELSLSGLGIPGDALGTSACVVLKAPSLWRVDPVLAVVGGRVIALGGACRFALAEGEDAAAVEVHEGGVWAACDPMPVELRESASATWLSTAATGQRVYVMDRGTGWTSWFDPSKRRWGPTRRLRPDAGVYTWGIAPGHAGTERLVLFGAKREGEGAESRVVVRAWGVDGDVLELFPGTTRDAMPSEMSEMLFPRGEDEGDEEMASPSIGVCGNATGGYVYNAAQPSNGAVLYELPEEKKGSGAVDRWERVPCAPTVHADPLGRAIHACSTVGLDVLPGGLRPLGSQLARTDAR